LNVYLFLKILFWQGEDVQGLDQPLRLINIIYESDLCCSE